MRFNVTAFVALLVCCVGVLTSAFDWTAGNSSVWLSAAAYCETNTYLTRTYKGYSAGFVPSYVIDDKTYDVQVSIFSIFYVNFV